MSSKGKSNMVGNREIAQEVAEGITYAANDLNQYTRISTNGENFTPEYDADGNQTLIQTSTGIWKVQYNGQNRAIKFESEDGRTVITCGYDYMGRRFEKKVVTNGTTTLHERYIYRGYLQIAAYDLREGHAEHPDLRFIFWDPTQSVATRPLAIRENGVWYTYGWDLTENICELYGQEGFIRTIYTYSPYGQVTAEGDVIQPIQWSSEMYDAELGLVYYNFRYYNPRDGRWTRRDPVARMNTFNLYTYCKNNLISRYDILGLYSNQSSAARAAIKKWVNLSIKNDIEYCGLVCKKKGKLEYTYTEAPGRIDSCVPHDAPCPDCYVEVAFWHTHGAFIDEDGDGEDDRGYESEIFSGYPEAGAPVDDDYGDKNYALDYDIDGYV